MNNTSSFTAVSTPAIPETAAQDSLLPSATEAGKVKIVANYALQQKLGSGSFAVVYKGVRIPGSPAPFEAVAVKAISRNSEKLTRKVLQNLEIEINILRSYRHRNIVSLHDVQKTERHFYLILEFCSGGDVQKLIRTRRASRVTEGLARRLIRDLASGLRFLWGQELIHRDIKPQNLLLTGPLPLDELNDPGTTEEMERKRQEVNFPSSDFFLKIADFGFARHLQSASLAETLCGSPLYMAPEILQHHRYDAKADLWSVGTVLFEMITGQPPFHGENQFDLLRNIQRKAVRLPPDVRVSPACVTLLRLLLNRNPLSRAGFQEFFDACDDFVSLGCNGSQTETKGVCFSRKNMGLGMIPEDVASASAAQDVKASVPSSQSGSLLTQAHVHDHSTTVSSPSSPLPISCSNITGANFPHTTSMGTIARINSLMPPNLTPLVPSPPTSAPPPIYNLSGFIPPKYTFPSQPVLETSPLSREVSSEENSFVMVEHSSLHKSNPGNDTVSCLTTNPIEQNRPTHYPPQSSLSPPLSPTTGYSFSPHNPVSIGRNESYMVVGQQPKGMLSTSPGTGGAMMGLLSGRARLVQDPHQQQVQVQISQRMQLEYRIASVSKLLAASEDVGRRAISVARLGDQRAYAAMRLLLLVNEHSSSSSLTSLAAPMEGILEEADGTVTDDSNCMDSNNAMVATDRRRRSSSTSESGLPDTARIDEEETEEMPFAISDESSPPFISSSAHPRSTTNKGTTISSSRSSIVKPTPTMIRSYFSEALTCYLKSLKMLKGSLAASQNILKELDSIYSAGLEAPTEIAFVHKMKYRCDASAAWLGSQFRGVLERGDATNAEIKKLSLSIPSDQADSSGGGGTSTTMMLTSVEELIFTHTLGYGREGAVKQLLGQYELARSCYRTAGLLAETLLMESSLSADDRKILEQYVDGFATRIHELDDFMLRQNNISSRIASATAGASESENKSSKHSQGGGVGEIVAVPPPAPIVSLIGPSFPGPPRLNNAGLSSYPRTQS